MYATLIYHRLQLIEVFFHCLRSADLYIVFEDEILAKHIFSFHFPCQILHPFVHFPFYLTET